MNSSPFARKAHSFVERGFSPLPIALPYAPWKIKGKEPGYYRPELGHPKHLEEWNLFCDKPMSAHEIERIIQDDPHCGIGLALGFNDVCGVDVDDPRAVGPVREVLGGARAPAKQGSKGATGFFRAAPGVKSCKFRGHPVETAEGKIIRPTLVEVLAYGNQTVIPDSIHPETGLPYRYVRGNLEDVRPQDLPILTPQHVEDIAAILAPLMPERNYDAPIEPVRVKSVDLSEHMRKRHAGNARKAFSSQLSSVSIAGKGSRNDTLYKSICSIGKFVHHGFIPEEMLVKAFMDACEGNGLVKENGPKDVRDTIADGLHASRNDPLPELADRPFERRAA